MVSFLFNSLELSLKAALAMSKRVDFNSQEIPDAVLKLLTNDGFTDTHILKIVKMRLPLLVANAGY